MHICLIVPSKIPVKNYGGTERIVEWLALEYLRLNHQITLIACPGSKMPGVRVIEAQDRDEAIRCIPNGVDIVHFHGWAPPDNLNLPYVFTLHGNEENLEKIPKNTVFISANHAHRHGGKIFVYNGINADEFLFQSEKSNHLLFFSKVRRRVKGARRALKLAKDVGESLVVAGGYRFDLLKVGGFFSSFRSGVRFAGEVSGAKKAQYFADAKALVFPIDWDEPFGLVMVEALMSGTPVVATRRGSVPEIIDETVGAFFDTDEEFPEALKQAVACSPYACRQRALEYFSIQVCAQNYLNLYRAYLSGELQFG